MKYTIKRWGVLNVVPDAKGGLDINVTGFAFEGYFSEGFNYELAVEAIMSRLQDEIKDSVSKDSVSKDDVIIEDMEIIK